ncbi:MAG: NlpC/P60 family protein [Flavisolibacter sp.]
MNYAINLLPVIPVRKEPAHRSEMVSQLLFGDYVTIQEEKDDFLGVILVYDQYEGWVQANQLTVLERAAILETSLFVNCWQEEVTINRITTHIPFGSPVYVPSGAGEIMFGKTNVEYRSLDVWDRSKINFNEESLKNAYTFYLNTPYLWGGKSVFGIDCSGFAQQVFKLFGIPLMRDAYQQATQGKDVATLVDSAMGDLAFFCNEKGRVTHVGIMLANNKIVHASGKVRIDPIDGQGIISSDTGKRTHNLHSIRRFF